MRKSKDQPHAKVWELMWMAPRCKAKCRTRNGEPCKNLAMANGRCRMHGGKSTGPQNSEGKASNKMKNWKHGDYSMEALVERKKLQESIREYKKTINIGT